MFIRVERLHRGVGDLVRHFHSWPRASIQRLMLLVASVLLRRPLIQRRTGQQLLECGGRRAVAAIRLCHGVLGRRQHVALESSIDEFHGSFADVLGGKPANAVMSGADTGYYRKPPEAEPPDWLWHAAQPHRHAWTMEVGAGAVLGYGVVRNAMRMAVAFGALQAGFDPQKADRLDTIGGPMLSSTAMRLFLNLINE